MIEAILQIPDEVLEKNLEEKGDGGSNAIITIFLNENHQILDINKYKNYEEAKNSGKISQNQIELFNCRKFQDPSSIDTQHKGFGGTRGIYSCSPIHIRLSRTVVNKVLSYEYRNLKTLNTFLNGVEKDFDYKAELDDNRKV